MMINIFSFSVTLKNVCRSLAAICLIGTRRIKESKISGGVPTDRKEWLVRKRASCKFSRKRKKERKKGRNRGRKVVGSN